jgi:hypothetical protein
MVPWWELVAGCRKAFEPMGFQALTPAGISGTYQQQTPKSKTQGLIDSSVLRRSGVGGGGEI